MNNIDNFLDELNQYCDFNLIFDEKNNTYLFDEKYINNINVNEFYSRVEEITTTFNLILDSASNKTSLIDETLRIINITTKQLEILELNNFEGFEKLNKIIVHTECIVNEKIVPNKNIYNLEYINSLPKELDNCYEDILYFLLTKETTDDGFRNDDEIEKVKLQYVMINFYKSLLSFENYLYTTKNNLEKYGYFQTENIHSKSMYQRCTVNTSKQGAAILFHVLFRSNIFDYPGSNEVDFERKMYQFINSNFNYIDGRNYSNVVPINNIGTQFTYFDINHKKMDIKKQVDDLIQKLNNFKIIFKLPLS
jgi:hypothetical protein